MLGMIKIHAGDFEDGQYTWGKLLLRRPNTLFREKIPLSQIQEVEAASEDSVKRLAGSAGWGIAGSLVLGPVGMLAGLLAGGNGKDVTFVCRLKDGRKFMGTASSKIFIKLKAAAFV